MRCRAKAEHLVLGGEAALHRPHGHAGLLRHVPEGRAFGAVPVDQVADRFGDVRRLAS